MKTSASHLSGDIMPKRIRKYSSELFSSGVWGFVPG